MLLSTVKFETKEKATLNLYLNFDLLIQIQVGRWFNLFSDINQNHIKSPNFDLMIPIYLGESKKGIQVGRRFTLPSDIN